MYQINILPGPGRQRHGMMCHFVTGNVYFESSFDMREDHNQEEACVISIVRLVRGK